MGGRLCDRVLRGEELIEGEVLDVFDLIVEVLGRGELVVDLLILVENDSELDEDILSCGDSDEEAETLGDWDCDSDKDGLIDSLELPDDDTVPFADWESDSKFVIDCFDERDCDTVEDCDWDDNADNVTDFVFSLVFVMALVAVMVGVLKLETDSFADRDDVGELTNDGKPEKDAEAVSEADADKV